MQFWLHPIVGMPATRNVESALQVAREAGYNKLIVAPLRGWNERELRSIPPRKVGAIEGAWHPLTSDNVFQGDAWLRLLGKRNATQAALPWDNYFWGMSQDVGKRMQLIQELFPHALFSGHTPENLEIWPGPRAWEINPDHSVKDEKGVLSTPGKLSVDFVHLIRSARNNPQIRLVQPERLVPFLERLVALRGKDIAMVHLHLQAKQVVPYTFGLVPEYLRKAFRTVASVDKGQLPIAVQFLPPVPLTLTEQGAIFLLGRMRKVTENLLLEGGAVPAMPVYA